MKKIRIEDLRTIEAITEKQKDVWKAYREGDNLALVGSAGTGKTFLAMYLALEEVLDKGNTFQKVRIIRSIVPTRDPGFLPGTAEEKLEVYNKPYVAITRDLFDRSDEPPFRRLIEDGYLEFESTSYLRGDTFTDTIVIVDEMQNLNFHELDSVITRVGENCKILFCGDYKQSDLRNAKEKEGVNQFLKILENLKQFSTVEFGWEDIVRSGLVRDYIMTKEYMGL